MKNPQKPEKNACQRVVKRVVEIEAYREVHRFFVRACDRLFAAAHFHARKIELIQTHPKTCIVAARIEAREKHRKKKLACEHAQPLDLVEVKDQALGFVDRLGLHIEGDQVDALGCRRDNPAA